MKKNDNIKRKTKILATLGPATNTIKKIIALYEAGANAFRLNCSHLNEGDLKEYIRKIRRAEMILKEPLGILVDLQGPKIRIGEINKHNNNLKKNEIFFLDFDKKIGDNKRAYLPHRIVFSSIKKNQIILIDDGKIHLKVLAVNKTQIKTKVLQGGILSSNKGINLPQTDLKSSSLTLKDKKLAQIAVENGADWIALSFVQTT